MAISTPIQAKSSKRIVSFTASAEGAEVTVLKAGSRSGKTLGSCRTPCELELKPKKIGTIIFSHPDYADKYLRASSIRKTLASKENPIEIRGEFGQSYAEIQALIKGDYDVAAQTALSKGDAAPVPWTRIPAIFPENAMKDGQSGWCLVRLDVRIDGKVENIDAFDCSSPFFKIPTETSVAKWRYIPAVKNRAFVPYSGVTTSVKYQLMDSRGEIAPPARPQPELP